MKLTSLEKLYVEELRDLYDAENQLVKALPKMVKSAASPQLKAAFEEHLEVTKQQAQRLEQIFDKMGAKAKGKTCDGMKGLISEGDDLASEDGDSSVLDAGLISAAQKVEHYEIAGYGCVRTYAKLLGHQEAANLLQKSLNEEEQTDRKLTQLAESIINIEAAEAGTGR